MPTETITFNKQSILKITHPENNLIKISFGLKKANLILENIEAIKEFAEKNKNVPVG